MRHPIAHAISVSHLYSGQVFGLGYSLHAAAPQRTRLWSGENPEWVACGSRARLCVVVPERFLYLAAEAAL
jgi:hypothetical protein